MAERRAVAFLDILGFRNKILNTPLDSLAQEYEALTSTVQAYVRPMRMDGHPTLFPNRPSGVPWCTQFFFSDSIILVANADSDDACLELLLHVWRLSQTLLARGLPLRGAIDYDEMYSNPSTGVFVGKALANAYAAEGIQDWIGISLLDSVRTRYEALFKIVDDERYILSVLLKKYPVPLKGGQTECRYTINWRYNYVVEKGTRSLFPTNSDTDAQRKIDNTLAYAKAVVDAGKLYPTDQSKLAVELRTFFVGGKEPPFPHGDDL
jgi:hypothetical protein